MVSTRIGILHPGRMGASVAAAAAAAGGAVVWASEGRGEHTARRATAAGACDVVTLEAMCHEAEVVVSVCPPAAAEEVAGAVARNGFDGLFVDANAVAPVTARRMAAVVEAAGARFTDGGLVGPPADRAGTTRLYLSGGEASRVAGLFEGSALEAVVVDGGAGAASALKMCYAAWTKGSAALLMAVRALAAAERVEEPLLAEWARSQAGLEDRSRAAVGVNAPKAWRFEAEMVEIARTFEAASLPPGFHMAAAEIYGRLAGFKDRDPPPAVAEAVAALRAGAGA